MDVTNYEAHILELNTPPPPFFFLHL